MPSITVLLTELMKLGPLLEKVIPALVEGSQLLGNAVPSAGLQGLLTEGEALLQKVGPLGQAIEQFVQAIEAHKAQGAQVPPTTT